VLINRERLDDVVARLKHGPEALIVARLTRSSRCCVSTERRINRAALSTGRELSMAWMKDGPSLVIS
jgi:hypothetical protein